MSNINKRKQRIIDATIAVLKDNTIEDLTVRKIAEKAGITTGAIYHHYKNKDALLFDVMKHSLHFTNKLCEEVHNKERSDNATDLIKEINKQVANRIKKVEEQKLHIQFFSDVIRRKSSIEEEYKNHYVKMIDCTSLLFDKTYNINSEYKKSIASILVAAMDGIAMQQSLGVLPEDVEKTAETFISFFNESIPAYLTNHKD